MRGLRRRSRLAALLLMGAGLLTQEAAAIPLFARQTALPCGMCHSPPPELNSFGRRFMLSGFALSSMKTKASQLPRVSVSAFANHTSLEEPAESKPGVNGKRNHTTILQQLAVYTGGAFTPKTGAYAKASYDGLNDEFSLASLDFRHVVNTNILGKDALLGVTVHTNPAFQDPWNSSAQRAWPYLASSAEPGPRNRLALDGLLTNRVLGIGGYAFLQDSVYLEAAGYRSVGNGTQRLLGWYHDEDTELDNTGIYLRLAKEIGLPRGSFTLGAYGFAADIERGDGSDVADSHRDLAIDGIYQWQKAAHNLTLAGSYIREDIDTGASRRAGLALDNDNDMSRLRFSAGYLFDRTYGATLGYSSLSGSSDARYFQTRSGEPDSRSYRLDLYWNPISKTPPKWYPWMSMRLGLQYVRFAEVDGASNDYNSRGRDASDNDTLTLYWFFFF